MAQRHLRRLIVFHVAIISQRNDNGSDVVTSTTTA